MTLPETGKAVIGPLIVAALSAGAVLGLGSGYLINVAISLAMWIALSQSWVVLSGMTGYISLGHAVFFGIGGYVAAAAWGAMPLVAILALSGATAGGLALLVGYPCLRVRGPYFVILTFGLAEFVKFAVINIEAAQSKFGRIVLGGPEPKSIFLMMLALATFAFLITYLLRRSRIGFALRAIREDEEAAETSGIPIVWYKLAAFCLSAFVPGIAGALFLLRGGYFEPLQAFNSSVSVAMITMAVIGGSDDAYGPLVGAVALVILSELLWANAPQAYLIIQGTLLVLFVLLVPDGIMGRFREFLATRARV